MKKNVVVILFVSLMFSPVLMAASSQDICLKMPGHWRGIFTYKKPYACKMMNGCTHLLDADVLYIGGEDYLVNITPAVGQSGEVGLQCKNGDITSPPGTKVTLTCHTSDRCIVKYEDAQLSAELMND